MRIRAAVTESKGAPFAIRELELDEPQAGEVRVRLAAAGICHTDQFTLSGADPEGLFPAILGHEGAGVVLEVGAGCGAVTRSLAERCGLVDALELNFDRARLAALRLADCENARVLAGDGEGAERAAREHAIGAGRRTEERLGGLSRAA